MHVARVIPGIAADVARQVTDLVLPPRCLACGTLVAAPHGLCATCWSGLNFVAPPLCARCGLPFPHDVGPEALCAACAAEPPPFERARAVLRYDDASRPLILAFKHGDRTDAAPAYGGWMARAGRDLLDDADLIAPVPLHWTRLARRRYNQSAMLAGVVAGLGQKPLAVDLLTRWRRTPSLGGLGRNARLRILKGSIRARASAKPRFGGARVLLVDDVLTSGATASVCARALLRGGARAVDVLVMAHVVRAE